VKSVGRPKKAEENRAGVFIQIRVGRRRKSEYQAAAAARGLTLSAWMRAKLDSERPAD